MTNAKRKQNLGAEQTRGKLRLSLFCKGWVKLSVKSFNRTDGNGEDHPGIVNGSGSFNYLDQKQVQLKSWEMEPFRSRILR